MASNWMSFYYTKRKGFMPFQLRESFYFFLFYFSLEILNIIPQVMVFSYFESLTSRQYSAAILEPLFSSTRIS